MHARLALLIVLTLLMASSAEARRRNRARPRPPPAPAPKVEQPSPDDDIPTLLSKAQRLYDGIEYDQVVPFVEEVLRRPDATLQQKLAAYLLQGSALAVIADPVDAEKPFRLLLRADPDFDLPPSTAPKILSVFRKVQAEERAIIETVRALERERLKASLEIVGDHPAAGRGGEALPFQYRLKDPKGVVDEVRLQYRKRGEVAFSSLALARGDDGGFRGKLSGEQTASDDGFVLEFYLETSDSGGSLLTVGSAAAPLTAEIAAGQYAERAAPPVPLWALGGVAATGVAVALAGVGLGGAMLVVQSDYRANAAQGLGETPVSGALLTEQRTLGEALGWSANGAFVVAGVFGLVTGLLLPFVNWTGEDPGAREEGGE